MDPVTAILGALRAINTDCASPDTLRRHLYSSYNLDESRSLDILPREALLLLMKAAIAARNGGAVRFLDCACYSTILMDTLFGSPDETLHCTEEELQWIAGLKYRDNYSFFRELFRTAWFQEGGPYKPKLLVIKRLASHLPLDHGEWLLVKDRLPSYTHWVVDKLADRYVRENRLISDIFDWGVKMLAQQQYGESVELTEEISAEMASKITQQFDEIEQQFEEQLEERFKEQFKEHIVIDDMLEDFPLGMRLAIETIVGSLKQPAESATSTKSSTEAEVQAVDMEDDPLGARIADILQHGCHISPAPTYDEDYITLSDYDNSAAVSSEDESCASDRLANLRTDAASIQPAVEQEVDGSKTVENKEQYLHPNRSD